MRGSHSFLVLTAVTLGFAAALVFAEPPKPRKVALLVGVEKYRHDFKDALFAERDVASLKAELGNEFQVVMLTGADATKENIEKRLDELIEARDKGGRLGKGDMILLAFCGHGLQMKGTDGKEDAFFCPVDALKRKTDTMVSLSKIIDERLADLGTTNLLLVDACRDDPNPDRGTRGLEGRDMKLPPRTAMLFGCSRGQQSLSDKGAGGGHGLFTYAVLKGLRGEAAKNGKVSWSALVNYVQEAMTSDDEITGLLKGVKQTPIHTTGELPFTLLMEGNSTRTSKDILDLGGFKTRFVKLPKGTFYMGWDGKDKPGQKTEIKEDFEIATCTVTQGQWQALMSDNPSYFSRDGKGKEKVKDVSDADLKRFPVETVSWDDAQTFLKKLNEKERGHGYLYRLPRESEWEYACRGGATSEEECSYHFYFARPTNDLSSKQANFDGNSPYGDAAKGRYLERPTMVDNADYPTNRLGLHHMHGNVYQWCADLYEEGGSDRVFRGGSWYNNGQLCRAAYRYWNAPDARYSHLGFRLARVPVR